jgi:hypothetical protein
MKSLYEKIDTIKPATPVDKNLYMTNEQYREMLSNAGFERKKFEKIHKKRIDNNIAKAIDELEKIATADVRPSAKNLVNKLAKIKRSILGSGYARETNFTLFVEARKKVSAILDMINDENERSKHHITPNQLRFLLKRYTTYHRDIIEERNKDYRKAVKKKSIKVRIRPFNCGEIYTDFWNRQLAISKHSILKLIVAMCAITGRRCSEVVQTMELDFKTFDKKTQEIMFFGQAKTRDDEERKPYKIKLLLQEKFYDVFIEKYEQLIEWRSTARRRDDKLIRELDTREFTNWAGSIRNHYRQKVYDDIRKISENPCENGIKNLRSFYACYLYAVYERTQKALLLSDKKEDVYQQTEASYISEILGHEETDINTANSYKRYSFAEDQKKVK